MNCILPIKKLIATYSYIVLSLLFFPTLYSQEYVSNYEFINIKEGISKLGVSSIIQDKDDYIWFGTNGAGLHRFDGINYKTYTHSLKDSTSISSSLVYCAYIDKKDRLWIGTEEGLNLYNKDLDHFTRFPIIHSEDDNKTLVSVRSIEEDGNNNLLLGTSAYGMFKFNMENFDAKKISFSGPNKMLSVNSIKKNNNGLILAATNEGLLEYDSKLDLLYKSDYFDKKAPVIPLHSLFLDKEGVLWLGSASNGIYRIEQKSKTYTIDNYPVTDKGIFSMLKNPDGTLLCGTENGGLIHLNEQGKVIRQYLANKKDDKSITSNSIWSLLLDKNERLWIGYYNSGIAIHDNLYDKFKNIESSNTDTNSLKIESVTAIIEDKFKNLWITTDGGGLDIFDPKKNKFTHINTFENGPLDGITSNYLECIYVDSNENIWIGSWDKGIFLLKKGTTHFVNFNIDNTNLASNTVLSITEDANHTIWFSTFYKGLHSLDPISNEITHYNSPAFITNDLVESDMRKVIIDKNQNIWVGTTRGLFKLIKKSEKDIEVISMIDEMALAFNNKKSSSHILSLYESNDGKFIWIGTKGAGLCRYDTTEHKFDWFNKLNGLTEENVASIIESQNGDLWISGNSGIHKYDPITSNFTNYTYNDGLLSNDFNMNAAFRDSQGLLYFGNYKGIDFFNPNAIVKNSNLTQVYLTDLKIFNEKILPQEKGSPLKRIIKETDSITLSSEQSVFTIEYTGINYTRPEKNQYAYYLEGLEKSWNYVGQSRSATYTNLDHGTYTFKLKAANNDGVWNETPLVLTVKILPPWWKTNWAIVSYLALIAFGLYLLNKLTRSRIKKRQSILTERKQREQEDLLNKKKLQFFTNISHEFRTPLTLMINPIEDIIGDESLNLPEKIKNKHKIIRKNTYRLHRLINELMDFRKLESDKIKIKAEELDVIPFTKDIVSYFEEEASSNKISLEFESALPDLLVWADTSMLEKIIFNILSNAFKVTPENGIIIVKLIATDKAILPLINQFKPTKVFQIIISDTGPGLVKSQIDKIFERFYQVENLNKTYYGGTGIGLEVVQNFVKLHKGKVEVNSKVGEGTTFKILLPLGNRHLSESEILEPIQETKAAPVIKANTVVYKETTIEVNNSPNTSNQLLTKSLKTLLIVEDNSELRNYLTEELKHQYNVKSASNGAEGLRIANKVLPDAIITDVIMPEMDGFEFCNRMKQNIATSHIPILMLTAKTQIDDRISGIENGADAYMVKPFTMKLVSLRLSQLITSRQMIFDKYFREISGIDENTHSSCIDKKFIEEVLSYINENISQPDLSVELLATKLSLSRSQLYRKIKALTGYSANEFIRRIRLQKAKNIIENGASNIKEVCYKVGFSSPSYFTKCFKSHFGILPTDVEPISI